MIRLTTSGALNSSIATNFNGPVGKMQFLDNNGTLYIPGAFSQLNTTTANNIAIIKMICDGEYACGSADGQTFASTPNSNLCNPGSASPVLSSGYTWTWTCTNGTGSSSCMAYKPTSDNVACGPAHLSSTATTPSAVPTTNLCNPGSISNFTGVVPGPR